MSLRDLLIALLVVAVCYWIAPLVGLVALVLVLIFLLAR